jgi:serine/threonine protein kinase
MAVSAERLMAERYLDRYEIVEPLAGSGGFGRVQKMFDPELQRYVALKVLDPLFKVEPTQEDKERFRREAQTLASLSYPTIPSIYDIHIDESKSDFRILFEWIEGTTVNKLLSDRGTISLEEARLWFANICGALSHAHNKGVVHRDIKPSNLIMTVDGSACYVVDFGISLRKADMERLTGSSPLGTPGYMSPEQERMEALESTSDIYSLGIVLYECLAGTRPAIGGYRMLNTFNDTIPPAIDDLVKQSLLREAKGRPQSAAAFLALLTQALAPHVNFTETISKGSLYEIEIAITNMQPSDFARLPKGQRRAIVSRIKDLVNVDQENLRRATAQLLASFVRKAHLEPSDDYEFIVENALNFGYNQQYGDWTGNPQAREALSAVAIVSQSATHRIISDGTVAFLKDVPDLSSKQRWYFHDLRTLLQNLLANPQCRDKDVDSLGQELDRINSLSHKWQ